MNTLKTQSNEEITNLERSTEECLVEMDIKNKTITVQSVQERMNEDVPKWLIEDQMEKFAH